MFQKILIANRGVRACAGVCSYALAHVMHTPNRVARAACAGDLVAGNRYVQQNPDRQPRRDRLPRRRHRAAHGHQDRGRVLRRRRECQARERLRRGGAHRRQRAQGQLPALGTHHRGGQGHRRAGDPPGLRLPQRERGVRAGLRRGRAGVHRPAAVGDPGDGPEGRVQAADGKGRRAAGARLPRREPGHRRCCGARPTASATRC